ncbi:MAG: hypothetical protein BWY80_00269 [Firmicutes bacterium ADurb.Bin456]|nr:MAG: hypothetical protein BWY80_00269 [Firmicutes bacterium ADurb.Bin456]
MDNIILHVRRKLIQKVRIISRKAGQTFLDTENPMYYNVRCGF